jgi:uncharacterized protein DUF6551
MATVQRQTAIETIPLAAITTDPAVNTRPVDENWAARKLGEGFDWSKFGVPTVSERTAGKAYVWLDGQNRGALARLAGHASDKVEAKVYRGLTTAEEAALFLGLNDNRQVKSIYKFLARVTSGEADAVTVSNTAAMHGWRVSDQNGNGLICASVSLEKVFRYGEGVLSKSLDAITRAWGHDADAANGSVIHAVGMVVYRYDDALPTASLSKRLMSYPGGPSGLIADARGLQKFQGGSVAASAAEILVRHYNTRRSTGRLPDWKA